MIALVNYGAGNIRSVSKALEHVGARIIITENPSDIEKADKIILPGVGAFGKAIEALTARNLILALREAVDKNKPFLGICLGLHLLFECSEENPEANGLSLLPGHVVRFPTRLKVPHLGWNQVRQVGNGVLWKEVPDNSFFYFAHSFYVKPSDDVVISGQTNYELEYTSAVMRNNLFGFQFHPEKSQKWGLKILENFVRL